MKNTLESKILLALNLIKESQLIDTAKPMISTEPMDVSKAEKIKLFIENYKSHYHKELRKLDNTYEAVPKRFRSGDVFGYIVWNHYTKLGGQFFYIVTGVEYGRYMVLLMNGQIAALDANGENVPLDKIKYQMQLDRWNLSLKDVLMGL
jgi:hypothetical protein